MLLNGADSMFSLPLKKDSDSLDVVQRHLATDFKRDDLLKVWRGGYARAPFFSQTSSLLERIVQSEEQNLFKFVHRSIVEICAHLGLETEIRISSEVPVNHSLKSEDKVLALCQAVGANVYINAMGGQELYSRQRFQSRGIELQFIQSQSFEYPQLGDPFVPWLSIIDVLMFNPIEAVRDRVSHHYTLI